jgi:hypothetical protein
MSIEISLKRQNISRKMKFADLNYEAVLIAFHETATSIMRPALLHHLSPDVILLNHDYISSIKKFTLRYQMTIIKIVLKEGVILLESGPDIGDTGQDHQLTWLMLAMSRLERGTALFST